VSMFGELHKHIIWMRFIIILCIIFFIFVKDTCCVLIDKLYNHDNTILWSNWSNGLCRLKIQSL